MGWYYLYCHNLKKNQDPSIFCLKELKTHTQTESKET